MKKSLLTILALTCTLMSHAEINDVFEIDGLKYTVTSSLIDDNPCVAVSAIDKTLTAVDIPANITAEGISYKVSRIDWNGFRECDKLASVHMPNTIEIIQGSAFRGCTSLINIEIPNSVREIYVQAFYDCTTLEEVTLPSSIHDIASETFANCNSLKTIFLPETVTSIGDRAFIWCGSLCELDLPTSIETIGKEAFYGCTSLKNDMYIPDSVQSLGDYAFNGCNFSYISTGNSLTEIPEGAFANCTYLSEISFGRSLTVIGTSAFEECHTLSEVDIPDNVKEIGSFAFRNCLNLSKTVIGSSVNRIQTSSFGNCPKLNCIYFLPANRPNSGRTPFSGIAPNAIAYVPKGSLETYASWSSMFSEIREMGELSLSLDQDNMLLTVGHDCLLTANITTDGDISVTDTSWSSSDNLIATVSDGNVTALKDGTAEITLTVTDNFTRKYQALCTINVTETSGIEEISSDDSPTDYYNLHGMKVNRKNLTPGIYIYRQADKSGKIIVR